MEQHITWAAIFAVCIWAAIRALNSDGMRVATANLGIPDIPKRALPWVALGLSVAAAATEAYMTHASWREALAVGLVAAAGAVFGQDLMKGIPGLRDKIGLFLLVGLALTASACAPLRTVLDHRKELCVLANAFLGDEELARICRLLPGERREAQRVAGIVRESGLRPPNASSGSCP